MSVGADGATHQMMADIAALRALPNLRIIVPCDYNEAIRAVKKAYEIKGPVYIRLGREKIPVFTPEDMDFEIGRAITLKEGTDVTIIATGLMVYFALKAAEELEKQNISARVINMHTIKPIDKEAIIKAAKETKAILTAEEHQIYGGLGSSVAEVLSQYYPVKMKILGMNDEFGQSGKGMELMSYYGLDDKGIVKAVKELVEE